MPLDSVSKVEGGIWVAVAGAIGWCFNSFLRWLRVTSQEKDREIERELKLSHSSIEYANTLREDIKGMRTELEELRDLVKGLYQRNDDLRRQNEEYAKHLSICQLASAT